MAGTAAALVAAGWWWVTTSGVTTVAQGITEAGRLSGLAAGVAVIALITLIARIGPLDRAIGTPRLRRWHEWLGRYAISMAVAHVVLITAGYALAAHDSVGLIVASFVADPVMVTAIAATVVFLVVGVVSAARVRRTLSYEAWHAIHLATYVAILLALIHQVVSGAQFAGEPIAAALWVAACVVPVVILLVNRLVRPALMNARHRFTLGGVVPEAPGVFSLIITGTALGRIPAKAGQYIRVHANARGLRFASNSYSFSSAPRGEGWRITVAAVGDHSRRLVALPAGTRLWLEGPMGGLILNRNGAEPVLLVGGGVGVTPIRALAEAALTERPGVPVVVLYRVRDMAAALFVPEWAELTAWAAGRLAVYPLPGRRTVPVNRLDAATVAAFAPWIGQADVLACGAAGLTDAVTRVARQARAASVRVESFDW
ncbi:MAG: ferric reductase-like transmembrane domain-containing protein [Micrococcales bacterium]|nr:ferric reductase-like transmembrane domain-containing protein [Micrococcales bacterium]